MAGYMRKLNGYVYDDAHVAAEKLTNGLFVKITADGVKKLTETSNATFRVAEKTTLWGEPAVVLNTVKEDVGLYFVENEWDVKGAGDYNLAGYEINIGDYVKMHQPVRGDQLITTVSKDAYASMSVGGIVSPGAGGTFAGDTIDVEGTITWVDSDDAGGTRPASVTITLLADGETEDTATVAPESGTWAFKFEDLDKYADGVEIAYTISAGTVEGYTASVSGYNVTYTLSAE